MNNKKNYKHRNQVRIIGGVCRGRKLVFEPAEGLRPTPDSVRERLFNWLGQDLTGKTVLVEGVHLVWKLHLEMQNK